MWAWQILATNLCQNAQAVVYQHSFLPVENISVRIMNEFLYSDLFNNCMSWGNFRKGVAYFLWDAMHAWGTWWFRMCCSLTLKSTKVLRDLHDPCRHVIHLLQINSNSKCSLWCWSLKKRSRAFSGVKRGTVVSAYRLVREDIEMLRISEQHCFLHDSKKIFLRTELFIYFLITEWLSSFSFFRSACASTCIPYNIFQQYKCILQKPRGFTTFKDRSNPCCWCRGSLLSILVHSRSPHSMPPRLIRRSSTWPHWMDLDLCHHFCQQKYKQIIRQAIIHDAVRRGICHTIISPIINYI